MKAIKLTVDQYSNFLEHAVAGHPASVRLIRSKMQAIFGFTARSHQEWIMIDPDTGHDCKILKQEVHLDFYNESQKTMFMLKYSSWL